MKKIVSFLNVLIFIFLILISTTCTSTNKKRKEYSNTRKYYDLLKSKKGLYTEHNEFEIIDFNQKLFLGLTLDTPMEKINLLFGETTNTYNFDVISTWNQKILLKKNLNILLLDGKSVGFEIHLPSNYYFHCFCGITGLETIYDLIGILGVPSYNQRYGANNEWNDYVWFINGAKVVFITENNSIYPSFMDYIF